MQNIEVVITEPQTNFPLTTVELHYLWKLSNYFTLKSIEDPKYTKVANEIMAMYTDENARIFGI